MAGGAAAGRRGEAAGRGHPRWATAEPPHVVGGADHRRRRGDCPTWLTGERHRRAAGGDPGAHRGAGGDYGRTRGTSSRHCRAERATVVEALHEERDRDAQGRRSGGAAPDRLHPRAAPRAVLINHVLLARIPGRRAADPAGARCGPDPGGIGGASTRRVRQRLTRGVAAARTDKRRRDPSDRGAVRLSWGSVESR